MPNDEPPEFFVPGVPDEEAEATFHALAALAGCEPPPSEDRIYRIEFVHDGERWTAEVGRQLKGERLERVSKRRPRWPSDPATVQAIFPGVPWQVVTDKRPVGSAGSAWENPFLVGKPSRVGHFTVR